MSSIAIHPGAAAVEELLALLVAHPVPVGVQPVGVVVDGGVDTGTEQEKSEYEAGREQLAEDEQTRCLPEADGSESACRRDDGVPQQHDNGRGGAGNRAGPEDEEDDCFRYAFHFIPNKGFIYLDTD